MKTKNPKTVEEDLESIHEDDLFRPEHKINPRTKKILVIITGAIILILFLSLTYLSGPLFNIVAGQIESKSVNNNVLALSNFDVIFSDSALSTIQQSYAANPALETSLCLIGEKKDNKYMISSAYIPIIFEQTSRSVTHEPCNSSTIIMFHTHPYKSCLASSVDLDTLKRSQLNNPPMLSIVMCEPNKFSVYK
jgi:hypothetical protein